MESKNNDIIYSLPDIEKYHKGLMTEREMHALEKAALDDPFLADALEGYQRQATATKDVEELKQRLAERIEKEEQKVVPLAGQKRNFSWWKVAAMVVLVAGAALIVYQIGFNGKTNEIAQERLTKELKPVIADSGRQRQAAAAETGTDSPAKQLKGATGDSDKKVIVKQNPSAPTRQTPENKEEKKAQTANEPVTTIAKATTNATPGVTVQKNQAVKSRSIANADKQHELNEKEQQAEINKKTAQAKVANDTEGYLRSESNVIQKTNVFRGRVTDEQNNALAFSNVINTRDSVGTYADANGYFNLTSPDTVLNVKVSSIGFEPSIVHLRNDVAPNRIKLEEDRTSLSEVVINYKKTNSNRVKNNMVLQQAEPADGWTNYDLYLANNLKAPEELKEKNKTSEIDVVELAFEVSANGEPTNITVKKSLCEACDREAIRLLKEGPKWKRRAKKGKTTVTIPFYNPGSKP